jgi:hypothetical protein
MYSIHQKAYFRMLTEPGHSIGITGASVEKLRELYPLCVDAQSAEQTLKFYNSEKDLGSFCAYMDPHCEYLNLATLFGVLEMLFAVLCLVFMSRRSSFGMFWCCAILGCMLWDDVLSKRWIWIGNAIIVIIEKHRECKNETLQQRAPVGGN